MAEPKLPPHSMEAEQSVLGAAMIDLLAWSEVESMLSEADFYRHDHRQIFVAMLSLSAGNEPIDVVTVVEWLRSNDLLEQAGGAQYVGNLAAESFSTSNVKAYAATVRDKSWLRQLCKVGMEISEAGFSPGNVEEKLDAAEQAISKIRGVGIEGEVQHGSQAVMAATLRLESAMESGSEITGMATGFPDLDRKTSGMHPGDLIVVAARPSMGKTAFAMNIVEHRAVACEESVLVFSMEMPAKDLTDRMASGLSNVPYNVIRAPKHMGQDQLRAYLQANAQISRSRLYVDSTPAISIAALRTKARRHKLKHGLSLLMVDYLQLMNLPGKDRVDREIGDISQGLKRLASELDIPVIALSQLNRGVESRPNKRPRMADLKESSAIEQDADTILFLYRDEVYNDDSPAAGIAEVIIGKQRNGPLGTTPLVYRGEHLKFLPYGGPPLGALYARGKRSSSGDGLEFD